MSRFVTLLVFCLLPCAVLGQMNIGDNKLAKNATLNGPSGIAIDSKGNVFIAERSGHRIRRVDAKTGIITTIVGSGEATFSGDNNLATSADIANPELIALDSKDNLYITDRSNSRIRRIDVNTGIITTVAGTGESGYSGDGGQANQAQISYSFGVGLDNNDNIYFADTENHVIRKIDASTGIITTIAGNGEKGFDGDYGPAVQARLNRPHNFVFHDDGSLIIGDSQNQRIRSLNLETGIIQTLYGKGEIGLTEDGEDASTANFGFFGAFLMYDNKLYFSEWINNRIRIIDPEKGLLESLKDADGNIIEIGGPYGIAIHSNHLYVSELGKNRVLKIDLRSGEISHFAGK